MSAVYIEESLRQVCLPGVSAASWERLRHSWVNPPCSEVAEKERRGEGEARREQKPTASIFSAPLEEETVSVRKNVCSRPQKAPVP